MDSKYSKLAVLLAAMSVTGADALANAEINFGLDPYGRVLIKNNALSQAVNEAQTIGSATVDDLAFMFPCAPCTPCVPCAPRG